MTENGLVNKENEMNEGIENTLHLEGSLWVSLGVWNLPLVYIELCNFGEGLTTANFLENT